jgi:trk system potassium uptake protein TrkH
VSRIKPSIFSASRVLTVSFSGLIAIGTLLLALPISATRESLNLIDAFFTATSAICVTGLIVVDTPNDLSLFGQIVLLLLIQIGGLGYMAISTVVAVALGRQLTVHERMTLQEALNVHTMEGLVRFVMTVLKLTLAFELAGALVLMFWWWNEFGIIRAAYYAVFHSVSAFNNAGFALFSDNMTRFRGDWVVNFVITTLVICGGLGFLVLSEIGRLRQTRRLSAHARLVLSVTGLLLVGGTAFVFVVERGNPNTLGPLGVDEAFLAAYFQAVVTRTAGFNSIDIGAMHAASLFLFIILMFIGAAPGGTGGGVKVSTFAVTLAALWAMVRGVTEPSLFRRRLAPDLVARAFAVSLLAFLALNAVAGILLVMEERPLLQTLFETTSAFGTVGLSTGERGSVLSLAGHFSASGKFLLAAMMFMGRVGPLTLAVAVARGRTPARIRYAEAKILVG